MCNMDIFSVLLARSKEYTKSQIDAMLSNKADLVDGLIPTSEIPPEVFERMVVVENDTARFALTSDDVQNGDVVYVNDTQLMYFVVDDTKLSTEAGYKPFAAGIAAKAIADEDGNNIKQTYQTKVLGSWTAGSETTHSTPVVTDTVLEAMEKIDNNQRLDESNISSLSGHFTFSANSGHYYLQPEQPSNPQDGDIWIG